VRENGRLKGIATTTLGAGLVVVAIATATILLADTSTVRPGQSVILDGDGRIWRVEGWPANGVVQVSSGSEQAYVSLHRIRPVDQWPY